MTRNQIGDKTGTTRPLPKKKADFADIDSKIEEKINELSKVRNAPIFPMLADSTTEVANGMVDDVFDDLRHRFPKGNKKLEVILQSDGGNIHAAYNLALLLRRYATDDLTFIIPRWAKSAATLLVASGNKILMTPVSELGPVDPQITQMVPIEKRIEEFSPLVIEATLELIRSEFKSGEKQLARGLLERLQFPLTLGGFKKSLEIGKEYLARLLTSRMFLGSESDKKVKEISEVLVEGYSDHGFCINIDEAKQIGLVVEEVSGKTLGLVWDVYKLNKKKDELKKEQKRKEMEELIKRIPPGMHKSSPQSPSRDGRNGNPFHA